jgi:hypothetical protein
MGEATYCTHVGKAVYVVVLGYILVHVRMTGEDTYCTHVGKAECGWLSYIHVGMAG